MVTELTPLPPATIHFACTKDCTAQATRDALNRGRARVGLHVDESRQRGRR
jgi:hypothetical protein